MSKNSALGIREASSSRSPTSPAEAKPREKPARRSTTKPKVSVKVSGKVGAKPRERPARSRTKLIRAPKKPPPVEEMLKRAMDAKTPRARLLWARRGLATRPRDATMRSMLLRQLYLAFYETRRFDQALEASRQNLALDVLPDVVHQDAARAAQALGDIDAAASHLRMAARSAPVRRRAFHWWTLGSLYFLAERYADAIAALTRAARWGTTDKPLYQGHLAMARIAEGEPVPDLTELLDRLTKVPAGQGYGRFVLGHLAFHGKRWRDAERHLEAFVKRSTSGRVVLSIALEGEIALARRTIASLKDRHIAAP